MSERDRNVPLRKYVVAQEVRTSAEFEIQPADDFWWFRHSTEVGKKSWIAVLLLTPDSNDSIDSAYAQASERLMLLLDRLHVVLQCAFSISGTSWFVVEQGDESDLLRARKWVQSDVVPIALEEIAPEKGRQIKDLESLKGANVAGLRYFREATRAGTAKTRLAMLAVAAEALAGRKKTQPKCDTCNVPIELTCGHQTSHKQTDKEALQRILGKDVYKALYKASKSKNSIRNQLMHGVEIVPEAECANWIDHAYRNIREFLQREYHLKFDSDIKGAPRPLEGLTYFDYYIRLHERWPFKRDIREIDRWSPWLSELSPEEPSFGTLEMPPQNGTSTST